MASRFVFIGFPPTTQLVATRLAYRLHTTSQRLFHETVTREIDPLEVLIGIKVSLPSDAKRIAPHLETTTCEREQILIEANSPLDHIFFPDSGVVSMMALYSDGSVIELATIGREGFAGVRAVFGAKKSAARFFVQIPGSAAKMSRAAFTRALTSMPSFINLMYSYV